MLYSTRSMGMDTANEMAERSRTQAGLPPQPNAEDLKREIDAAWERQGLSTRQRQELAQAAVNMADARARPTKSEASPIKYDTAQAVRFLKRNCDRNRTVEGAEVRVKYGVYDATVVLEFSNGEQRKMTCDSHAEARKRAGMMRAIIAQKWQDAASR